MDYKEKLQEARRLYETANVDQRYVLESLFPELKESDDERIRKALISFLKSPFVNENITDEKVAPWIFWLEKQGEQKPAEWSEEDEEALEEVQINFEINKGKMTPALQECYDRFFDKIKTLNPYLKKEWSEEDKEFINDLIGIFDGQQYQAHSDEEIVKWLKSIRLPYNKEWDENDEEMLKSIIATCELACEDRDSSPAKHLLEIQTNWLKSLKDRVQPVQEWSEEDESHIRYLIECLEHCKKGVALTMTTSTSQEYINWLKSLRPQKQWKPSEEQIKALDFAIDCTVYPEFNIQRSVLKELLEQLKKLREE